MTEAADRAEYLREVCLLVYGKEPADMIRPPSNYEVGIAYVWFDRGVPLATVNQAVSQMERHPSIGYVRRAVEQEEERRCRALRAG